MKHFLPLFVVACYLFTPVSHAAEYNQEVKVTPLLKTAVTSTGQPIRYPKTNNPLVTTVLVEIPPGAQTGWHIHTQPCFAYILQGTISVEVKGKGTFVYHAGQAIAETLNTLHNGRNLGKVPVKIVMTVVGEQGKPIAVRLDKNAPNR